jgi:hypothetical protein
MWPSFSNQKLATAVQHFALARNRVRQDDVEGGQAVGGDDQQLVGVDGVDVADLALVEEGQAGDGGFEKRSGHGRGSESKTRIIN